MKFEAKGLRKGPDLDEFRNNWVKFTSQENGMILKDSRVSSAQLLVINLFCGADEAYAGKSGSELVLSTNGPAQGELEALFRGRGRALAFLLQSSTNQD